MKITRKIIAAAFAAALSVFMTIPAFAQNAEISVYVNGERLSLDESPRSEDDRTLVPMRAIFEALGAEVKWDGDTETASASLNGTTVSLTVDGGVMLKNGSEIALDVPARMYGDRVLVPVRAVSEAFGSYVDWDEGEQTVFVDDRENPMQGTVVTDEYRYPNYDGSFANVHIFDKDYSEFFGMELLQITDEQGAAYAEMINSFKNAVPSANVYNLIAPTAAEFYAAGGYQTHYTPSIRKIYSRLSPEVIGVNAVKPLMEHAGENIYFRTDHHWTQLGAYYAYSAFINVAGDTIDPPDTFSSEDIYGYYGSLTRFTSGTGGYDLLTRSPDVLRLYYPKVWYSGRSYNDMYLSDYIKSMSLVSPGYGNYNCFIEGDYPIEVYSTGVENGRSLAIIKESYGNAFATWAVNNFETVYIIDYRKFNNYGQTGEYTNEFSISEFHELTGFTDLLIISYPVSVTNTPEFTALSAMAR
ncbi:MAG TPA: hypothetical protein H9900_01210 [Candidatus Monoglobus merdigallinarum]|uniref:Copper amine oxidase-like N-terminal domain-containing protein n=1 Tax=Candidatus Monoglobus merdigallinarum TaxID=2838698 RepID=A0A9D1PR92_9FIRM|nr:hypothetical protein [Candidatus Monoglobus merdigallinarum]